MFPTPRAFRHSAIFFLFVTAACGQAEFFGHNDRTPGGDAPDQADPGSAPAPADPTPASTEDPPPGRVAPAPSTDDDDDKDPVDQEKPSDPCRGSTVGQHGPSQHGPTQRDPRQTPGQSDCARGNRDEGGH